MIGVSSGVAATLGLLKPSLENFTQMAACMGAGNVNYTDLNLTLASKSKEHNRKIDRKAFRTDNNHTSLMLHCQT